MVRRIGFPLHRLLQNRTLRLCAFAAATALLVLTHWTERRVRAQSGSPPAMVTTTQLGISPGAPTAAESTEPVAAAAEGAAAAPVPRAVTLAGPRTPLAEDSDNLLKLANDLQTEVNRTTKDMLSVNVVREAGQIEQLAHRMRAR